MDTFLNISSALFLLTGSFLCVSGGVGLFRFPDFYTRLHATGKGDTLAVFLSLIGLALYEGFSLVSLKIIFIAVFMFIAQPTATHAISRAGMKSGLKPWTKKEEENA